MEPRVSVIVPCYNEVGFIKPFLQNIADQDYPCQNLEVFVVDGMSNDGTRAMISAFSKSYSYFHLLDNQDRYVSFALNKGLSHATGEVIIRMDAHAEYPSDYISRLVEALYQLNADNVGGSWITLPGDATVKALAIASALSSPFGVGNAHYRLSLKTIRQVDTVPFGCYRREVFDRIGLFDEDLLRNQDDGFNAKLTRNGGHIFLIPDIRIRYYARTSVGAIWRMMYQYGLFKPLVNKKVGRPATLRQFVPPLFVLVLLFSAIGSAFLKVAWQIGCVCLAVYLLIDLVFTVLIAVKRSRPVLLWFLPWVFFVVHVAYGLGYLHGVGKFVLLRKKSASAAHTR